MSTLIAAFGAGVLFGVGLLVSGLAEPSKVLAFLDIAGDWDPSLALTMGAAILVAAPPFALARRRRDSLLGEPLQLPVTRPVSRGLLAGSLLFGVGWGLAGVCPGPALVLFGLSPTESLPFALAMLAGMVLFEGWRHHASGT